MKRYLLLLLCAGGCDAAFVDRRPPSERGDPAVMLDLAAAVDLLGADLLGVDLSVPAGSARVIAEGTFMGRAGHAGSGDAQLHQRADGVFEVRLGSNFTSSGVPAPVIYLTSRADMGNTIDAQADVELGIPKFTGAQSFVVPPGKESGRRNVFIYCRSFRVEVAKAALGDK